MIGQYSREYKKQGDKFGMLTIIRRLPRKSYSPVKILAACDCGVIKEYFETNVTRGKTTSCGCINRAAFKPIRKAFSSLGGYTKHPLFGVWKGMISRCTNRNDVSYMRYGAIGVTICNEWLNFFTFYDWAINNGWSSGLQLDKDYLGDGKLYSPESCCFISRKKNCRNRKSTRYITIDGVEKSLAEWCEIYNKKHSCVIRRIDRGYSPKEAFETPSTIKMTKNAVCNI